MFVRSKAGHIGANLGDDAGSGNLGSAYDALYQFHPFLKRGYVLPDLCL